MAFSNPNPKSITNDSPMCGAPWTGEFRGGPDWGILDPMDDGESSLRRWRKLHHIAQSPRYILPEMDERVAGTAALASIDSGTDIGGLCHMYL